MLFVDMRTVSLKTTVTVVKQWRHATSSSHKDRGEGDEVRECVISEAARTGAMSRPDGLLPDNHRAGGVF